MSAARRLPTWLAAAAVDGALLGLFMVSAALFGTLLELPGATLREAIPSADLRRGLMGLLMGATAAAMIYSPLGKRSGAHFNPATTLTFWRLGRVTTPVAIAYIACQFAGGVLGLWLASAVLLPGLAAPEVHFVATLPGPAGVGWAFVAEVAMTFALMSVVLRVSQHPRRNRWTGLCAATLVALYITLEAPVSGMSINPARTFASAVLARDFTALWLYFTAPVLGMLLAAELFVRRSGAVRCAKLHHQNTRRCDFRCDWRGA